MPEETRKHIQNWGRVNCAELINQQYRTIRFKEEKPLLLGQIIAFLDIVTIQVVWY